MRRFDLWSRRREPGATSRRRSSRAVARLALVATSLRATVGSVFQTCNSLRNVLVGTAECESKLVSSVIDLSN